MAVFAADHRLRDVVSGFVFAECKPFVLDDSCPRGLAVGVIDGGVSLEIRDVQSLGLEADAAVLEGTERVPEIGVDGAGVDDFPRRAVPFLFVREVVDAGFDFDAVHDAPDHFRVAANRDALVSGVEIVVIKSEAHGEAADDEGGKLGAGAAPLFLGVAFDEGLVNVGANEGNGLFFEIFRRGNPGRAALFFDFRRRFFRGRDAPHLIEGVHIEGEAVEFPVEIRNRGIGETVPFRETIHVIPDVIEIRVENMRAVAVDVDALDGLGVNIPGDVVAFL